MAKTKVKKKHDKLCEGHIDCPTCGPESCGKPVVWDQDGRAVTVLCWGCMKTFGVTEA
jgi:hypothetical protein